LQDIFQFYFIAAIGGISYYGATTSHAIGNGLAGFILSIARQALVFCLLSLFFKYYLAWKVSFCHFQ
jgi:hypothetical protein